MCRLLGWSTSQPTTLAALLGEQDLVDFTELSCKHGDGWGIAWAEGERIEVVKRSDAARESDDFTRTAHIHPSDLGTIHLRWATAGLPVQVENTHPFSDGRTAFEHNGAINPADALDAVLSEESRRLMRGTTDSERYYLAVREQLVDHEPEVALARTVTTIAESFRFTSLNCLLMTPEHLYAVCRYDPVAEAAEEQPDYFNLRYRVTPTSVVVASTGWGEGWESVANGHLLTVERHSLLVSVRSLADILAGAEAGS